MITIKIDIRLNRYQRITLAETFISLFFCFCLFLFLFLRCCFMCSFILRAIAKITRAMNQNFGAWFLLTNYLIQSNKYLEKFERHRLSQQTFLSLICFFCRNYNTLCANQNDPFSKNKLKRRMFETYLQNNCLVQVYFLCT